MRRSAGLQPLGATRPSDRAFARLAAAWTFVVGPALAGRTRPLRLERDILVIGCWELARIGALRDAAAAVWPQVQARIAGAFRVRLTGLQVLPCDPPPPPAPPAAEEPDPLRRALARLEAARRERIRLGLEPGSSHLDDPSGMR